ncbi:MAG: anthranilate synthase component I family protein [Bacteroidota bacterium]|nr:anthranilate synthase component I family protein [Bacteroidota bacterium]
MKFNDLDCFLLQAQKEDIELMELLILEKKSLLQTTQFCILPYVNATIEKPKKSYFLVNSSQLIHKKLLSINESQGLKLKSKSTKEDYIRKVIKLKEHIQLGNIYEINFCIEFYAKDVLIDPVSVFIKLQQLTKAPYCKLVKLNDDFIISASPELFLKKQNSTLFSKPIKGTIKRGSSGEEDERLKLKLGNSIKERTENVMAVDVARNDLSIIAQKGTVKVNKLYNIESFETVHQMVSTVSCELNENANFEAIINATFPMASMTGAPKVSAMKLISEFEDFERNYYSGAMGLIEANGDFELSVIIRSIFYNQETKRLSIAVGSAITHLCDPEKEYEECLLKANALLKALNAEIEN